MRYTEVIRGYILITRSEALTYSQIKQKKLYIPRYKVYNFSRVLCVFVLLLAFCLNCVSKEFLRICENTLCCYFSNVEYNELNSETYCSLTSYRCGNKNKTKLILIIACNTLGRHLYCSDPRCSNIESFNHIMFINKLNVILEFT